MAKATINTSNITYNNNSANNNANSWSGFLLFLQLSFLLFVILWGNVDSSTTDFNVIIPEICDLEGRRGFVINEEGFGLVLVNISRIKEMVLLGLRMEELRHLSINIAGQEETCGDGTFGVLKLMSLTMTKQRDLMDAAWIVSTKPQWCELAGALLASHGSHLTSWTCSEMPGIVSIKPPLSDMALSIVRFLQSSKWKRIIFTKLKNDKSPFCDSLSTALESSNNNSASILVDNNYAHLSFPTESAIEGIFLCISYEYGLHNFLRNEKEDLLTTPFVVPVILIPEWPLSPDILLHILALDRETSGEGRLSPGIHAILSQPQALSKAQKNKKKSEDEEKFLSPPHSSLPPEQTDNNNNFDFLSYHEDVRNYNHGAFSKPRVLESLMAGLILRSVKVSLWLEGNGVRLTSGSNDDENESNQSPDNLSPVVEEEDENLNRKFNLPPFHFLLLKVEGGRWHQLTNLIPTDGSVFEHVKTPTSEDNKQPEIDGQERGQHSSSSFWFGVIAAILVLLSICICLAHYARGKFQRHLYTMADNSLPTTTTTPPSPTTTATSANANMTANRHHHHSIQNRLSHQKKLIPRARSQGAYKLLLTSRDICFNSTNNLANNPRTLNNSSFLSSGEGGSGKQARSFDGGLSGSLTPTNPNTLDCFSSSTLERNYSQISVASSSHHQQQQQSQPNKSNNPFSRSQSVDNNDVLLLSLSSEKPDLLKGPAGLGSKQQQAPSIANIKSESFILNEHQARYKGDLVHLRKLCEPFDSDEPFEVKTKAMNVLETIHGLRHENMVTLIGVLTEGIPSLVWELCSRGSLHDVIKQQDIKLDWAFKLSLLTDLVRGMKYLHTSLVRVHGFLTSFNCVIDARWVLKITDYGVLSFHHNQTLPLTQRTNKELLWTSPELLRDEGLRRHGTQPGDVYSFAIIMQEVLVRGEPYCMLNLSTQEILEKVKRPPPLIRPSVSKGAAPPEAINIMRQCWAEIPDMRPDFTAIHDLFKTLNHGRKANIVDTMFEMLEKYSNNLEELIRERTEQLDLEKKKTEQLLNRMLPSLVAEKLKFGLPVDPEEFPEVTIYFSDIVGFTTISAYSTPFEVVDLLNDLYTSFDATINDYNVYKVETIGDAYMVVGGAPVRSPDHADQIATMALDLLYESGKFRIRHLPYTPLRLRIGIHTGPCCAGVVGLTMPRYCLFGDTVNTASRMESTGAPWRIHISNNTKSQLDKIGGYILESRGVTDIKGKGPMQTYWLLGKEGFDKKLPPPPTLSESHGLDEKSILYGRTGVGLDPLSPPPTGGNPTTTSSTLLDPPKAHANFSLLSGDVMRSLSPAEEVAHQLLNGRPAARGLRRQFSLDQGPSHHIPTFSSSNPRSAAFRKAPSLEESKSGQLHHHVFNLEPLSIPPTPKPLLQEEEDRQTSTSLVTSNEAFASSPIPSPTLTVPNNAELINLPSSQQQQDNNNSKDDTKGSSSGNAKPSLSPRSARGIAIKSSSLTIVEENPHLE